MVSIARIFEIGVFELFENKGHAFITVAAVAIATMAETPDHRFVDLHAGRSLRTISRNGSLGALRCDRARAVRDQKSDQDLQWAGFSLRRLFADEGEA